MIETTTSALDLFQQPAVITAIEDSSFEEIKPVTALSNDAAPIEFEISAADLAFIDLANTLMLVKCKIVDDNGHGYTDTLKVAVVNNFLHSLFCKVDVSFNGKVVSSSGFTYAQTAYIQNLLSYSDATKKGELSASVWEKDDAGEFDNTNITDTAAKNSGFMKRHKLGVNAKLLSMIGRVYSDVMTIDKYLLDGVSVRVKFIRQKNTFCLMRGSESDNTRNKDWKVSIQDMSLFVRKIVLTPSCHLGINKALQNGDARYDFTRTEMRTFALSLGSTSWTCPNAIMGTMPNRVTICFSATSASQGDYEQNPLQFSHHNLSQFQMYYGGKQIPMRALTPSFGSNDYARCFMNFQIALKKHFTDDDVGINYREFGDGYFFLIFHLKADFENEARELPKRGNLQIEASFKNSLLSPVTAFILAEYDASISVDRNKQVSLDYLV